MRLVSALRFKNQAAPASPASGDTAVWTTTDTVPRLKAKDSAGVERYLHYEFYYNVKDYGATGNGTTDDAATIQAAIAAAVTAGGGTVYVPYGTYKINSELEITGSNIKILLNPGATIRRGSSGMQYMLKNFNSSYAPTVYGGRMNITIEGGVWDADGATISAACTVIVFAHSAWVTVRDVQIINVPDWHAIEINSTYTARITNCKFFGFRVVTAGREMSEAVQIDLAVNSASLPGIGAGAYDNTPCFNILVEGCSVSSYGVSGLGGFGKLVGSHAAVDTFEHENIRVIGNFLELCNDYGVAAYNWNNAVIANNQFNFCNGGVLIEIPTACTTDLERFVIQGNTFFWGGTINNGTAVKDKLIETRLTGTGVMRSVSICNNQIKNFVNVRAIYLSTTSDVVCQGNSIRNGTDAASVGIQVNNSALGVYQGNKIDTVLGTAMIFENASTECVISGSILNAAANGIKIDAVRCVLQGNIMRISSLSKYGIQLTTTADETVVVGNHLRQTVGSPTQAGIDVDGAMDAIIQNNWIKGWGITEGSTGPINRGGTLNPNITVNTIGTTNLNAYQ
jgi:hypothetical protein